MDNADEGVCIFYMQKKWKGGSGCWGGWLIYWGSVPGWEEHHGCSYRSIQRQRASTLLGVKPLEYGFTHPTGGANLTMSQENPFFFNLKCL